MENQTNNLALPKTSNTASNPDAAQSSKPVMNAVNTSYFVADQPSSAGTVTKIEQEKKQDRKVWSILSIIATTIPIILWGYCFIVSGGSASENASSDTFFVQN